jgi:hypothetical protein
MTQCLSKLQRDSFLPWKDLSETAMQQLLACKTPEARRHLFAQALALHKRYPVGPTSPRGNTARQNVLLDLCANLFVFGRTHGFNAQKLSTLFSIVITTHIVSCGTSFKRARC